MVRLLRWGVIALSAIPLLLILGLLVYWGAIAARHAYAHHLTLFIIPFVMGTSVATVASWSYPNSRAVAAMELAAIPLGISLAAGAMAGLYWEAAVAFCVVASACALSGVLSVLWWPLRGLSQDERRAVFRRLLAMSHNERLRILSSRDYDDVPPAG